MSRFSRRGTEGPPTRRTKRRHKQEKKKKYYELVPELKRREIKKKRCGARKGGGKCDRGETEHWVEKKGCECPGRNQLGVPGSY